MPASDWVSMMIGKLAQMPHVTLLPRTTVFGYMDHNFLTLTERVTDHMPKTGQRTCHASGCGVRAKQVILARARMNGRWSLPAMTCPA